MKVTFNRPPVVEPPPTTVTVEFTPQEFKDLQVVLKEYVECTRQYHPGINLNHIPVTTYDRITVLNALLAERL